MAKLSVMAENKAYKDSGEDWIGDVPSNWGVVPIRGSRDFPL